MDQICTAEPDAGRTWTDNGALTTAGPGAGGRTPTKSRTTSFEFGPACFAGQDRLWLADSSGRARRIALSTGLEEASVSLGYLSLMLLPGRHLDELLGVN